MAVQTNPKAHVRGLDKEAAERGAAVQEVSAFKALGWRRLGFKTPMETPVAGSGHGPLQVPAVGL